MPLSRATKLMCAGATAGTVCVYFATQARGNVGAPDDSLVASKARGGWARTFVVTVPVSKMAKVGPEYAQPVTGSNTYSLNLPAIFKRYAASTLDSEAFRERCLKIGFMKPHQPSLEDQSETTQSSEASIAIPGYAAGLEVEASRDTEAMLRERGTGVKIWLGVREVKPQWVGDQHSVEFCYTAALDTDEASGVRDYILYWVDIWQCRRIINDAARASANKQMSFVVKHR